jgi:hypothetical protein
MRFSLSTWLHAAKRKAASGAHTRGGASRTRPHRIVPRLEALEDRTVPSTLTVTSAADDGCAGTLRAVIAAAQSGDTITFARSLRGQTITLTGGELAITKSLDIDGLGPHRLTIGGNDASRVFDVSAGVTVTIAGMTITDGLANGSSPVLASTGGGILNFGSLTLCNDILSNNQAIGDPSTSPTGRPGGAQGGGVANLGTADLTVFNSAFTGNQALGADGSSGTSAGNAEGGAIDNFATASVTDSRFTSNVAQAGSEESGTLDATGTGGGIHNIGSLSVTGSTFSHNQAIGGNDSSGARRPGLGAGGAIISGGPAGPATLVVSASTFDHNQAIGGNGNQGGGSTGPNDAFGGAIHLAGGTAAISSCKIDHNAAIAGAGGAGQNGGLAFGGAIDAGNSFGHGMIATVSDCTIAHNAAIGGQGGPGGNGGDGWGGGLADVLGATLTVNDSTVNHNRAIGGEGGNGGNGGNGLGGGIYEDAVSTLTLTGDRVRHNRAIGSDAGDSGSDGQGVGGGLYLAPGGVACADLLTVITHNHASTGYDDVFGTLGNC